MKKSTQKDLVIEFFTSNPNRDIQHPEVVDWVVNELRIRTGEVFRDPDRCIRKLAQEGFLMKMGKGIYKYDPEHVANRHLEYFTSLQKKEIFERDGYACVVCGRGAKEGFELHATILDQKTLGGKQP